MASNVLIFHPYFKGYSKTVNSGYGVLHLYNNAFQGRKRSRILKARDLNIGYGFVIKSYRNVHLVERLTLIPLQPPRIPRYENSK